MFKKLVGGAAAGLGVLASIAAIAQWGWPGRVLRSSASIPLWAIVLLLLLVAGGVGLWLLRRAAHVDAALQSLPAPPAALLVRWAEFRAKIDYLAEFYTPPHTRSVQHLLRGAEQSLALSLTPREQQLLTGFLSVMNMLTTDLKFRGESLPATYSEAVMLIRDFESLLGASTRTGLDEILGTLAFVPAWEENKQNYFRDSDLLRRTYREFGREVNLQLDERLFSVG